MQKIKKFLIYRYFTIRTWWPLWFYVLNYKSRALWKKNRPPLSPLQKRIVDDLRKYGIATTTLGELLPEKKYLDAFERFVANNKPLQNAQSKKTFLQSFWELHANFDLTNPFFSLSLEPMVTQIANEYMEMYTKLNYVTMLKTLISNDDAEKHSQAWHRDSEEKRMLKVFTYINDVDENTGPFIYIPESHYTGKWGNLFPQRPPEGSYPNTEDVKKYIPQDAIRTMTGKAGTVIFCDTYGLHKGGHATKSERFMATLFYTAPTWSEKPRFTFSKDINLKKDTIINFLLSK